MGLITQTAQPVEQNRGLETKPRLIDYLKSLLACFRADSIKMWRPGAANASVARRLKQPWPAKAMETDAVHWSVQQVRTLQIC